MAVTNTDDKVVDDDKEVTEEDLHDLKYPKEDVETEKSADEATKGDETEDDSEETGEDDSKTDDQTEDEEAEESDETDSDEDSSEFVKEFPNIKGESVEDYARGLEEAYKQSTAEALRLKALADKATKDSDSGETDEAEVDLTDPVSLFMKQKMDEEITVAFGEFSKHFPQVQDPNEYNKFTQEVATLSQTILNSQKRLASPKELYSKAAVILGWEPDNKVTDKDKLGNALKNSAAISKTNSATKKSGKSKVTDQMVAANRLMYPDKTDAQIREELEPYVT